MEQNSFSPCDHSVANIKSNINDEYLVNNLLAETCWSLLKDWLKEKDRNSRRLVNKSELYKDSWLG